MLSGKKLFPLGNIILRILRCFRLPWAVICCCLSGGSLGACDQDLPTIDMTESSRARQTKREADQRPVLRVAIGALISPESTRDLYYDLVTQIGKRAGYKAVFAQRRTYAEVNHLLATGKADIAFVCSGPYVRGHEEFGLELLVVPVVAGKTTYRSHIIVNQASGIRKFAQLKGKKFAFTDAQSNTGHLVPAHLLARTGKAPETFFSETFFTNGHDNSINAVSRGIADGAAVDSLIWDYLRATTPEITSRARIIWTSPPFGIPPVVATPKLSPSLKARLRRVFLALHKDARTAPLLRRLNIDRFQDGDPRSYTSVRRMLRELKR